MLFSGIESGADPVRHVVEGVRRQLSVSRVIARQRVPVGDEIEAVVLLLQRDPVAQRADEMAEMQPPGRPHARNDACPARRRAEARNAENSMAARRDSRSRR